MKAIGCIIDESSNQSILKELELPVPTCGDNDLLVKVVSISVNPVDTKVRQLLTTKDPAPKILGWDAAGEVVGRGVDVTNFNVGDKVFYAGSITRPGSNAEYQCVDASLVSLAPKSLSMAQIAALPLTSITAAELLFEHFSLQEEDNHNLLIVGAAGGVGSMLIQLAKTLSNVTIVATASRESSKSWAQSLGADHVINHSQPLKPQLEALDISISHIASCQNTVANFDQYIDLITPFGKIGFIDTGEGLDPMKLKPKSLSLHYEYMFARPMHQAKDRHKQGEWLTLIAKLIDEQKIKTTIQQNLGQINAENLEKAHQLLLSQQTIGKIVLASF